MFMATAAASVCRYISRPIKAAICPHKTHIIYKRIPAFCQAGSSGISYSFKTWYLTLLSDCCHKPDARKQELVAADGNLIIRVSGLQEQK